MSLLDQNGVAMQLRDLLGRAVAFNFIYTACSSVCPVQTFELVQILEKMPPQARKSLQLVSVSLDPLSDTPKALKAFAKRFKADIAGWSFLTGRPQDIERLAESLWLFQDGKGRAPLETHSTTVWLVDRQGKLVVRHSGSPMDSARVGRELTELALADAATATKTVP